MTMNDLARSLRRGCWLAMLVATCASAQMPAPADVIVDAPPGPGPFPAIVLASGQGYHMSLPALAQSASALVKRGVVVYRFNWAYWTREPKGNPSDDLSVELRQLRGVIALARSDSRVDPKRVAVGGKSLGSRVAWQAFRSDPSLTSAALLTPVCNPQAVGKGATSPVAANYRGIEHETRPMLFALGDHDPLCEPKVLFKYAATAKGPVRISVVGGDHGFAPPAREGLSAEVATRRNVAAVADAVADFVAQLGDVDRTMAEVAAPLPGYMIVEYEVTDPAGYREYLKASGAARAAGGDVGTYLVRGAQGISLSGEPPRIVAIIQFASVAQAIAFDLSPAYSALKENRDKALNWRSYVVEGLPK
ncbi:hypothetical protein BH10PSE17_BH10PSE17_19530 [soil metagenome]